VDKPKIEVVDLLPIIGNELRGRNVVFSDEEQRAHRNLKTLFGTPHFWWHYQRH
jgi:hypothetical protein